MIQFYAAIKLLHIAAVGFSGGLFLLRGAAVNLGQGWAMAAPLRYLSYAVDTVLLGAAVTLAVLLHQYPFVNSWLTAKVLLLIAYVVLGSLALKRGRTKSTRLFCWVGALGIYAMIITVALNHDPLGFMRNWVG